jgi:hypothetical protein
MRSRTSSVAFLGLCGAGWDADPGLTKECNYMQAQRAES